MKVTPYHLLRTMACLLTAWVMIGCEKEAAVEFNLIYPAAFPSNNYIASR